MSSHHIINKKNTSTYLTLNSNFQLFTLKWKDYTSVSQFINRRSHITSHCFYILPHCYNFDSHELMEHLTTLLQLMHLRLGWSLRRPRMARSFFSSSLNRLVISTNSRRCTSGSNRESNHYSQ